MYDFCLLIVWNNQGHLFVDITWNTYLLCGIFICYFCNIFYKFEYLLENEIVNKKKNKNNFIFRRLLLSFKYTHICSMFRFLGALNSVLWISTLTYLITFILVLVNSGACLLNKLLFMCPLVLLFYFSKIDQ